ncbi:ATP-binding protein [Corynebacterium xerosis]|uniref:ATP-binding protein n=1 Tax=Corynebacterium xerosis TaxID=1725 RepID=A0A2N6SYN0_9CORY|nr:precorrin-3B C(17)-methyltransferase [Corynebacterium xerosis]PMC62177.1 ATP-binding protein [Corynebacterium xerosis]
MTATAEGAAGSAGDTTAAASAAASAVEPGHLYGVGLGPGDPGLITRRGADVIAAADVVAFHAGPHGRSTARRIAGELLDGRAAAARPAAIEELLVYPVTRGSDAEGYAEQMGGFYAEATQRLAGHLSAGRSVAVLSLGDPMLYSSYQHLHRALEGDFPAHVIPGVPSVTAAAAELAHPLAEGADILSILPATAGRDRLSAAVAAADCLVIMKLGGHVDEVRDVLRGAGMLDRARVVVRATMGDGWTAPLADIDAADVPYFAVVVVGAVLDDGPDRGVRVEARGTTVDSSLAATSATAPAPATAPDPAAGGMGEVVVIGLGPGPDRWLTPEAAEELERATDVVGYSTYVARVPERPGQTKHMSDNRVEGERAAMALDLAKSGAKVAVVSSGDAGVFAMAAAVLETADDEPWRDVPVRIVPGMTAAQAVASRVGAPLGHDFAMLSLSDRLKPWATVEKRLRAVLGSDMAFAVYNPASKTRRAQVVALRDLVAEYRDPATPVIVARAVGAPEEKVTVTTVAELDPEVVDMRTMLIVGASSTKAYAGVDGPRVFTARHYGGGGFAGTGALGGDR